MTKKTNYQLIIEISLSTISFLFIPNDIVFNSFLYTDHYINKRFIEDEKDNSFSYIINNDLDKSV